MKAGRHICTECNSIYEEPKEALDPTKSKFDSLAESWKCECGAGKDKYQPCSCVQAADQKQVQHETSCAHS
jgi:rubredoxin